VEKYYEQYGGYRIEFLAELGSGTFGEIWLGRIYDTQ
jgi:hypothetical protein